MKKLWKIAIKDKNYGVRGHKLFAILEFVLDSEVVTYTELNRFSYNYTRRCKKSEQYTGKKFDKIKNRGYIGSNLYGGYIGQFLAKTEHGNYMLSLDGEGKLAQLRLKFGDKLSEKFENK
jgi:hypothetical protein